MTARDPLAFVLLPDIEAETVSFRNFPSMSDWVSMIQTLHEYKHCFVDQKRDLNVVFVVLDRLKA